MYYRGKIKEGFSAENPLLEGFFIFEVSTIEKQTETKCICIVNC